MHAQYYGGPLPFVIFYPLAALDRFSGFLLLYPSVRVYVCLYVCFSRCLCVSPSLCLSIWERYCGKRFPGKRCFLSIYWTILQLTLGFLLSVIGITAWKTERVDNVDETQAVCFVVFLCFVNIVLLFSFVIDCFPYPVSRVYAFRLWFSCLLCVRFTICFHIHFSVHVSWSSLWLTGFDRVPLGSVCLSSFPDCSIYISDSTVIHHSRSVCVLAIGFPPTFFWY